MAWQVFSSRYYIWIYFRRTIPLELIETILEYLGGVRFDRLNLPGLIRYIRHPTLGDNSPSRLEPSSVGGEWNLVIDDKGVAGAVLTQVLRLQGLSREIQQQMLGRLRSWDYGRVYENQIIVPVYRRRILRSYCQTGVCRQTDNLMSCHRCSHRRCIEHRGVVESGRMYCSGCLVYRQGSKIQ
jgi:hypothetical protein